MQVRSARWMLVLVLCGCGGGPKLRPSQMRPPQPVDVGKQGASTDAHEIAETLLSLHNEARAGRGLAPLRLDPILCEAAEEHAVDMARRGKMGHSGADGSSPFDRIERVGYSYRGAAENVAAGQPTPNLAMADWLDSRGHRANILGKYTDLGVARAVGSDGTVYWCAVFGNPTALRAAE